VQKNTLHNDLHCSPKNTRNGVGETPLQWDWFRELFPTAPNLCAKTT